ncbi:GNAT family N-acetyltransferase [Flavihumibacter fluvii]|uniref:GNAT family N-acetyltransferase n=1 Tax=Flavihumibacter fluvii TaxID=2838157 RepID=UPI001BDF5222|nr:GNAT family N-acetyltransferase [Flavihumibacter fluvii]ULQ54592.1 GNAT family N-acetyltransferase [Flavihumibacter fluvii]
MRIETTRLFLLPLSYDQLVKYMRCDNSLEEELHLQHQERIMAPALKEAFEETILPNVADPAKNYLYNTLWTAISKAGNLMVGDICIVGEPTAAGEIEIGYGTYDQFKGKGFMTEAVGGIIEWAKTQVDVKAIIASTEKTNTASFRVLEKNGFVRSGETDTLFKWTLPILV